MVKNTQKICSEARDAKQLEVEVIDSQRFAVRFCAKSFDLDVVQCLKQIKGGRYMP